MCIRDRGEGDVGEGVLRAKEGEDGDDDVCQEEEAEEVVDVFRVGLEAGGEVGYGWESGGSQVSALSMVGVGR